MYYEFKIGWCPFCNQGWAEIVKDVSSKELLVLCSECEAIWNSPEDFLNDIPNANKRFTIERVVDANFDEIKTKGWDVYIDET